VICAVAALDLLAIIDIVTFGMEVVA